jgi:hypothetical protein
MPGSILIVSAQAFGSKAPANLADSHREKGGSESTQSDGKFGHGRGCGEMLPAAPTIRRHRFMVGELGSNHGSADGRNQRTSDCQGYEPEPPLFGISGPSELVRSVRS